MSGLSEPCPSAVPHTRALEKPFTGDEFFDAVRELLG